MTQFHEGQEVEALCSGWSDGSLKTHGRQWRKAKVIIGPEIWVEFADGTRGLFAANRIRQIEKANDNEDDELESGVLLTKAIDEVLAEDKYAEPPAQWYDE